MAKEKDFEYEYDPIKEKIGGKDAEKVIWTTKALHAAVEGLRKGLPLKSNPFIGKETRLLKPDLVYRRTKEEIEDYIKCMKDPVYFASKCYLKTPEGIQPVVLRDYQIDYLRHLENHNFSIFLSCRQSGKSTTTAIYCLWVILFNNDKNGLILSKSGPAGRDLLDKIKEMYCNLPYFLKIGTRKWNQGEISFDNNSVIATEAFSPTAGLGKTINFLILDEFAWCPPNDVELFYNNIIPTITTDTNANVCIMSTQNGFNLFYKLWKAAITKQSTFAPFKVDWNQVPEYNKKTKQWEKRTEAWKQKMIGILGSEEDFYYQYGTQFSASDKCLVSRNTMKKLHDNERLFVTRDDLTIGLMHPEHLKIDPQFNLDEFRTGYFAILIDLAEGGGGDYTVFNIIQILPGEKFKHIGRYYSNDVDIEHVAVEFWLLTCQLFNDERTLFSLEWNTYGALFYQYLNNLNDPDYMPETFWRNNISIDGVDMSKFIQYKKGSADENVPGIRNNNRKTIPGIRFNGSNKVAACALLKMLLEKGSIDISDLEALNELENFEDKNGNGSYKASYGHDDIIMTFCQIPLMQQASRYKYFLEDMQAATVQNQSNNMWDSNPYTPNLYGNSYTNMFTNII